MGVSQVIIPYLLIVVWSLFVVSQDVNNQTRTSVVKVDSEGGPIKLSSDTSYKPREHMLPVNKSPQINNEHMFKVNHTKTTSPPLPAFEVGQKNDNKTSVPKKDATLIDTKDSSGNISSTTSTTTTTTTTTSTTTTTPRPHKPTLTIGEDEGPPNPDAKTKSNDTQNHGISIESVTEESKKTDYVVPIVVVILSVPLVAIVFSVLYKRGADWWQHRHYRRMDFLIEGMYNN